MHVVSDVHGSVEALSRAGDGADVFICLGDLVLFLDYDDHSQGVFADLFGATAAGELIELRTAGRFDEARDFSARLWLQYGDTRPQVISEAVRAQYKRMFAVMPTPAYLTYGNVDIPSMWAECLRPDMNVLDGEATEIGGLRFGFVGGGLRTPMRTPNEIDDQVFAAKVAAVGPVDILCSHIPPSIPELLYDVQGRRLERGSEALLEAVRATQPRYMLYGHVHNPLVGRTRIGRTECINVGHFRGTGEPYRLTL